MAPWYKPLLVFVPEIVENVYNFIMGEDEEKDTPKSHKSDKIPDRTIINEEVRQRIKVIYNMWSKNNKRLADGTYLSSQTKLATHLNQLLELNKSPSYYRRIFKD